jgi:hypothetical protein
MSALAQLCRVLVLGLSVARVHAEPMQPILTITAGEVRKHFTAVELLSRTDLASVEIPPHVDYNVSLTLQAVPLLNLLEGFPLEGFDQLEASAADCGIYLRWRVLRAVGFVAFVLTDPAP